MFNFPNIGSAVKKLELNPASPSPPEPTSITPTVLQNSSFSRSDIERSRKMSPNTRVELSCLSPDHRSFHTLHNNDTVITQSLPLNEVDANPHLQSKKKSAFRSIRTKLPSQITQVLTIDEPIELLCVDNDTPSNFLLPLLCIYTPKSVFVIQIQYEKDYSDDSSSISSKTLKGEVISVHEPFEAYLLSREDVSIQRIRSAPQSSQRKMHSTICNRGAMVMLCTTEMDACYESHIVLFHGWSNKTTILKKELANDYYITSPATVHSEQTDTSPIVDMAFSPSMTRGLSDDIYDGLLWNSSSLVLTTENGSLYILNPIVFDNTIYPKRSVWNSFQALQLEIIRTENLVSKIAECRRSKAALQYLKSLFDLDDIYQIGSLDAFEKSGYYIPTKLRHGGHATSWPVALQGPIYKSYMDDNYEPVECLELIPPFSDQGLESLNSLSAIGMVLGRKASVDYIIIPSAASIIDGTHVLIPRFAFEDDEDSVHLNVIISESGILVERLIIENGTLQEDNHFVGGNGEERVCILIDPFMDQTMLHHVSPHGVITVTTNAISLLMKKLTDLTEGCIDNDGSDNVNTHAFSTIEINDSVRKSNPLNGVIISGDSQLGHVMVIVLSDGSMESINMTAAIFFNEENRKSSSSIGKDVSIQKSSSDDSFREVEAIVQALDKVPSLSEQISSLCQQVTTGISNMNKIVGSSTKTHNISPGMVAALLATKQSSEQEIFLPLNQIHALVTSRIPYLETMRQQQLSQIEQLKEVVKKIQERATSTTKKRQLAENNSKILAARVNAVLSTVRDLTPNLTQAEQEYFKDIDRCAVNVAKWEKSLQEAKDRYQKLQGKAFLSDVTFSDSDRATCDDLLSGEEEVLNSILTRINGMENIVNKMLSVKGILSVSDTTC